MCYLLSNKLFVVQGGNVKIIIRNLSVYILLCMVSACASRSVNIDDVQSKQTFDIPINKQLFTNYKAIDVDDDIFELSKNQQETILLLVKQKQAQGLKLHQALASVLSSKLSNFTYYGATYNAEKTMRMNSGNCMSLAILTTAYAKLLGLKYSYREVNTIPVFEKRNNLILSSSHVQTILYDTEFVESPGVFYFQKPSVVIDYFPNKNNRVGKSFTEPSFVAKYYRNLASNALVENKLAKAFALAETALEHDKSNVETINLLSVIHRRSGDIQGAENIYQTGLKIDQSNLELLSNYIVLLRNQGRVEEAQDYQQKLDKLDDPNPYHWLEQAYLAQKEQKHDKAIRYYRKALINAPYLNQAYLGLYQIYRERGRISKAKDMLNKALEWTYEDNERKQYKYKLYSLAQL